MNQPFQFVEGPDNLQEHEIVHAMVPGRGREGEEPSRRTLDRVTTAAFYIARTRLALRGGNLVMSGGKTPADTNLKLWTPTARQQHRYPNLAYEYQSKPEAFGMDDHLDALDEELTAYVRATDPALFNYFMQAAPQNVGGAIPDSMRRVEPFSIDTVTNFANSEFMGLFGGLGNKDPMVIFAQEQHLMRCMKVAAKVARRPFAGVIVPEIPGNPDKDDLQARIAGRLILRGLSKDTRTAEELMLQANEQANAIWGLAAKIKGDKLQYQTYGDEKEQ